MALFTGTEHLLAALVTSPSRSLSWLKSILAVDVLVKEVEAMMAVTKGTGKASFYSSSLERSLQLGSHVWAPQPLPSEGLLLGLLLAHRERRNACGSLLGQASGERDLLELLLQKLPFARSKLNTLPPLKPTSFSFSWNPPISSPNPVPTRPPLVSNLAMQTSYPASMPPPPAPKTHWVIGDYLACGGSPGQFDSSSLLALVTAGVDTFVCLQSSYTEYGCRDYRRDLRQLANNRSGFPPHPVSFLHCPIPDFGVLDDQAMLAFISLLASLLRQGRCLYVHCYGGHGRTGTVLLHLLSVVGEVDMRGGMEVLQRAHKARGCSYCAINVGELEAESQEKQAERLETVVHGRERKMKHAVEKKKTLEA